MTRVRTYFARVLMHAWAGFLHSQLLILAARVFADVNSVVRLHMEAMGETLDIEMRPNDALFASSYKEAIMHPDGRIDITRSLEDVRQDCHFRGSVRNKAHSIVSLSNCVGGFSGAIQTSELWVGVEHAAAHFEALGRLDELHAWHSRRVAHSTAAADLSVADAHIVFRIADLQQAQTATCAVKDRHSSRWSSADLHLMFDRNTTARTLGMPANSFTAVTHGGHSTPHLQAPCTGDKYVEVFLVNDYSRYADLGVNTEAITVATFNAMQGYYLAATSFDCRINLRLSGIITFVFGTPSAIQQRACNTPDPNIQNAFARTNTACCSSNLPNAGCSNLRQVWCRGVGIRTCWFIRLAVLLTHVVVMHPEYYRLQREPSWVFRRPFR